MRGQAGGFVARLRHVGRGGLPHLLRLLSCGSPEPVGFLLCLGADTLGFSLRLRLLRLRLGLHLCLRPRLRFRLALRTRLGLIRYRRSRWGRLGLWLRFGFRLPVQAAFRRAGRKMPGAGLLTERRL